MLVDAEVVLIRVEQLVHVHLIWALLFFINPQLGHPLGLSANCDARTCPVFARQDDPLEVILVRRCRLGEGATDAWTCRGQLEFKDVIDGVEDEALQSWLEDAEGIGAFGKHKWLVLPLRESSNINSVPIGDHHSGVVVRSAVIWRRENRYAWRELVRSIPSVELVPRLFLLMSAHNRPQTLLLQEFLQGLLTEVDRDSTFLIIDEVRGVGCAALRRVSPEQIG